MAEPLKRREFSAEEQPSKPTAKVKQPKRKKAVEPVVPEQLETPVAAELQEQPAQSQPEPKVEAPVVDEHPNIPSIATLLKITNGDRTESIEAYKEMVSQVTDKDTLAKRFKDPNDRLLLLYMAIMRGIHNDQETLLHEMLTELKKQNVVLSEPSGATADKRSFGKHYQAGPTKITGKEAKLYAMAKLRGLKKVYLLNSGFHVVLRPFTMSELNSFIATVDEETAELGRTLGGHFYMSMDAFVRRKFMDIIRDAVVDSNLVDYSRSDTLLNAVSIHDYDTLTWAACSLIYKDGVKYDLVCVNPECGHRNSNQMIDLNKLRWNTYDRIPTAAMEFLEQGKPVGLEELARYRDTLLGFVKTVVVDDNERYTFRVPTMGQHCEYAASLNSRMLSLINDNQFDHESPRAERLMAEIAFNFYRAYTPWIRDMQIVDGESTVIVDDQEALEYSLEVSRHENSKLSEQIGDFMRDTKLSFIRYFGLKCPKCGKQPSDAIDDYVPIDPQNLFFFLAVGHLSQTGN